MNFCLPYKLSHHQLASRRHSNTETFCWISLESTQRPQSDWDFCRSRGDSTQMLGHKISSSQAARRKHTFSVDIHQKYFVYFCVYAQFQKMITRQTVKICSSQWWEKESKDNWKTLVPFKSDLCKEFNDHYVLSLATKSPLLIGQHIMDCKLKWGKLTAIVHYVFNAWNQVVNH